jgi:hypothetical protein
MRFLQLLALALPALAHTHVHSRGTKTKLETCKRKSTQGQPSLLELGSFDLIFWIFLPQFRAAPWASFPRFTPRALCPP